MNADEIAHSLLFNTSKIEASINIVNECVSIMTKACKHKDVKMRLKIYKNQYKEIANTLISEYDVSTEIKMNRFAALEEIFDLIFDQFEERKKSFKFDKKVKITKCLYEKRTEVKDLLHYNEFTFFKFFERYKIALIFGYLFICSAVFWFKLRTTPNELDAIQFMILELTVSILTGITMIVCMSLIVRERRKGRFIRPFTKDKILTYIGLLLPFLIILITYLWNNFKL